MGKTIRNKSIFRTELDARASDPSERRWLFVPYDQLSDAIGPLSREDPDELGICILECPEKASRRPYHKQKLALVLANLRHFALEQAERGVAVDHRVVAGSYAQALRAIAAEKGGLRCMRPAELELRAELAPLVEEGLLEFLPHEGWLTSTDQFVRSQKESPPWRMDSFYRLVRRESGYLMNEHGKPLGGKFSFDADNRKPWNADPPAPISPAFEPDAVTSEVGLLVEEHFADHPGRLDLSSLPATKAQALASWTWAKKQCLPQFGPYEDAMSTESRTLFHTRVSSLLNLSRLLPRKLVEETCELSLQLGSQEGFVRQVLGWREFVRHVHEATSGFRDLPEGYSKTSYLKSAEPLPPAYWGAASGLACLDEVVRSVHEEGYSHHITRLMILSNIGTLLDVAPRELSDWFWALYTDAYDWVVEPNVIAMGSFGVGDLLTTKPYVSGAAYIARMSDYCSSCAFDPKKDCPITPLYWAFLDRHRDQLQQNPRMRMPYASLGKRAVAKRKRDASTFKIVRARLEASERLEPAHFEAGHTT